MGMMTIIPIQKIKRLPLGVPVKVSAGFARNYLIPEGLAVFATAENLERFEQDKQKLEAQEVQRHAEAEALLARVAPVTLQLVTRCTEEGKLYGSVGVTEILKLLEEQGFSFKRQMVRLTNGPIRETGEFAVELQLHPEICATITVRVSPQN